MAIKIQQTEKLSETLLFSATPSMKAQVETLASDNKVSVSEVLRQAVQQLLDEGE
jgi:Ribbon-helix-helix protein, copG family